MDSKEMGELLSRIDERTEGFSKRQEEEIRERRLLSDRVGTLENWKFYLSGSIAAAYFLLCGLGYAIKEALHKN